MSWGTSTAFRHALWSSTVDAMMLACRSVSRSRANVICVPHSMHPITSGMPMPTRRGLRGDLDMLARSCCCFIPSAGSCRSGDPSSCAPTGVLLHDHTRPRHLAEPTMGPRSSAGQSIPVSDNIYSAVFGTSVFMPNASCANTLTMYSLSCIAPSSPVPRLLLCSASCTVSDPAL